MSIASLSNILKIFGGGEPTEEEKRQLAKEATLMALARCTSADSNIKQIEVETVREIVERLTGEPVKAEDVRVAAQSALFESAPLDKYLASVGRKIDSSDRAKIMSGLEEVIRSDDRISSREIDFFNMVANALGVSPAEAVGLVESD